ncbi:YisL family protein [Peribacillus sp. SCS-155]|uniref:YisL family protein n=1 Tax=Peribacillus sedimenti TaxID=3115297 RepID=UPI0039060281
MTHMHITAWLVAAILFFVGASMYKGNNAKGSKIVHMIVRLFYILIIISGILLFTAAENIPAAYNVKALVGIIVIVLMEMILVRSKKRKSTGALWAVFALAFVVVLYLGFSLPQGFDWF